MRNTFFGAVILVSLAACWGPVKGTSSSGGGTGGAGGDSCAACGDVVSGEPKTALCSSSASFFAAIEACACGQGQCAATCYDSLCSGFAADAACQTCMQSMCASSYALCAKDSSQ